MSARKPRAPHAMSRRQFIRITSAGSAAGAAVRLIPVGAATVLATAEAQAEAALGQAAFATLAKMARDIYPHDRFEDKVYIDAVAGYGPQMAKDATLKKLLTEGVGKLDGTANQMFGAKYAEIADEAERVRVLKALATTPFFKKVRGDLVVSLYNQPAVWGKLGYQGSSWERGGYLERGFNDQSWMGEI